MITIGKIAEDDLDELSALYQELVDKPTDKEKLKENFAWISVNPDYYLIGAKVDQRLVGSVMGIVCRDVAGDCRPFMILENIIVKADHHREGIGKTLVRYIEDVAKERGCHYLFFVSSMERKEAHRFYESLGYPVGMVQGFKKYL